MKKLLIILCAALCLAIGLTGCANASGGSGSDDIYRAEMGVITNATYNTANNTINSWTSLDYATIYSLRQYLYNNTISNYESGTGNLDDVRDLFFDCGMSSYEVSANIELLQTIGNNILFGNHATDASKKVWLYVTR